MSGTGSGLAVRAIRPVAAGLTALGHDAVRILRAVGLELSDLSDPEARVPHETALALWEAAIESTGDEALGLHVADAAPVEAFDVHAYAVLSSATVREAFGRACRYQRLVHDSTQLRLSGDDDGGEVKLRHALPGGTPVPRPSAEFLLTAYVRFGRLASGDRWAPREVRFAHAEPRSTAEHERVLRAPLRFHVGENAVLSTAQDLEAPNPKSDPGLVAVLDRYADGLLRDLPRSDSWSERVRARLAESLCDGPPTAAALASGLGMSPRTLQRRLEAEHTTFVALLDQLRRERAVTLLTAGRTSIAEIAFLLGFSELSAFYRAFRRWTGTTPAEFRRSGGTRGQAS